MQSSLDGSGGAAAGAPPGARPRKPYTMTKTREKWTPEEHQKFVEAIRLFGRSWKRIEGARARGGRGGRAGPGAGGTWAGGGGRMGPHR
jgi:hypothetical protein